MVGAIITTDNFMSRSDREYSSAGINNPAPMSVHRNTSAVSQALSMLHPMDQELRSSPSAISASTAISFMTAFEDPWESREELNGIDTDSYVDGDNQQTPRQSTLIPSADSMSNNTSYYPFPNHHNGLMNDYAPSYHVQTPESPTTPSSRPSTSRNYPIDESTSASTSSKRFSSMSSNSASTIVEAIIVHTPPRKIPKLRHVSKTSSLRSFIGSSESSVSHGPLQYSCPEDFSYHFDRLRISNGGKGSQYESRRKNRIVTEPILRHQPDSQSLRSDALAPSSHERSISASYIDTSSPKVMSKGFSKQSGPVFESLSVLTSKSTRESLKSSSYHSIRSFSQKAIEDSLKPVVTAISPSENSKISVPRRRPHQRNGSSSSADFEDRVPDKDKLSPYIIDTAWNLSGSIDRRVSDDVSNKNLARLDWTRRSIGASTIQSEDHPRQLYYANSPFSQLSTSDILVTEATAINIFPHNNESLVVIQPDRKNHLSVPDIPRPSFMNDRFTSKKPIVTITRPVTPPTKQMPLELNSPLKNPRSPPSPPALPSYLPDIHILPATPGYEDEDDNVFVEDKHSDRKKAEKMPQRSSSLIQKARKVSDQIARPSFGRTISIRRKSKKDSEKAREQKNHLSPFWHPRDFWEGISDSDSDILGYDDNDRLPPGGDTSAHPRVSIPRRLTQKLPGFRGSGGFLIGNSLGLNRHGTNMRRHHISLPMAYDQPQLKNSVEIKRISSPPILTSISLGHRRKEAPKRRSKHRWKPLTGVTDLRAFWRSRRLKAREQKAEKRRDAIRKSIGAKFLIEDGRMEPMG